MGAFVSAIQLDGEEDPSILARLRSNTEQLRTGLKALGFAPLEGESAIIPIIVGETSFAIKMSAALLDEGVFVTGFGFPVVPEGTARVRVQASAALSPADIERALEALDCEMSAEDRVALVDEAQGWTGDESLRDRLRAYIA